MCQFCRESLRRRRRCRHGPGFFLGGFDAAVLADAGEDFKSGCHHGKQRRYGWRHFDGFFSKLKNQNADNRPIIGVINLRSSGTFNQSDAEVTRLTTVHSRGDLTQRIRQAVEKEKRGEVGIYYVNQNEARALLEAGQSQVLGILTRDGFLHTITEKLRLSSLRPLNSRKRSNSGAGLARARRLTRRAGRSSCGMRGTP